MGFLKSLINPFSKDEDKKRQEFILNVILMSILLLTFTAIIITILVPILMGRNHFTASSGAMFVILGFFILLLYLSKKGLARLASYLFIALFLLLISYLVFMWGADLPQAILTFALIIVISSILVGTRFSFLVTAIICIYLLAITLLHEHSIVTVDTSWKAKPAIMADTITTAVTFFVIVAVSWLSNREIERSLRRARASEKALKEERDSLEIKVEERTKELKEAELEKMKQMSNFAEIGRLASGIVHDLINPLTALSLNLSRLKGSHNIFNGAENYLSEALLSSKRMEEFLLSLRKQIGQQEIREKFSPNKEINEAIHILSYKANKSSIEIKKELVDKSVILNGNSIKFHQAVANLISNAIDAFDSFTAPAKQVIVSTEISSDNIIITVRDFGKGIEKENLQRIFDPFFTTKDAKAGTGIGLYMTKNTIENDFGGTLEVESMKGEGSKFTITIPLDEKQSAI